MVPSRWAEPLSRSIMEPLACGIPVVSTRVGGSPEVLTGWLSEFLVKSEDAAALADRLSSLHDWRTSTPVSVSAAGRPRRPGSPSTTSST